MNKFASDIISSSGANEDNFADVGLPEQPTKGILSNSISILFISILCYNVVVVHLII